MKKMKCVFRKTEDRLKIDFTYVIVVMKYGRVTLIDC